MAEKTPVDTVTILDPVLSLRLQTLHEDVNEIKLVLRDLTAAITKLALIEERQTQAAMSLERAFKTMEKLDNRVGSLESKIPISDQTNKWVERVLIAAAAVTAMFIISKVGLV